jgi:phospholipase/lecithinase/hemolysin
MKLSRTLPLAAAALLLAACGQSPTAPAAAPSAPSLDGGNSFGSGGMNNTAEGGNTMGSGNYSDPGSTTTSNDSTQRGGNYFGGGS